MRRQKGQQMRYTIHTVPKTDNEFIVKKHVYLRLSTSTGSPATAPYAIPWGIAVSATVKPAMQSWKMERNVYVGAHCRNGSRLFNNPVVHESLIHCLTCELLPWADSLSMSMPFASVSNWGQTSSFLRTILLDCHLEQDKKLPQLQDKVSEQKNYLLFQTVKESPEHNCSANSWFLRDYCWNIRHNIMLPTKTSITNAIT